MEEEQQSWESREDKGKGKKKKRKRRRKEMWREEKSLESKIKRHKVKTIYLHGE